MSASIQYPANLAEYQQSCPSSETTTGELSYTDSYNGLYSSCPSSETWDNYRPVDVPLRDESNYRGRTINYYIVTPNCPHCHHVLQLHQVSPSELNRIANEQRAYQEHLYLGQISRDCYPQARYSFPPPQALYPYQSYYNHQYGYSGGYSYGPPEHQNYGPQQTNTQAPSLTHQSYPIHGPAAENTHQQVIPNGECEYYSYPPVQTQTPITQTVKCQLTQEPLFPISSQPLPKKVDWSYTPRKSAAESGNNSGSSKFCWKYLEDPSFSLPNPRRMQPSIFEVLANADKKDTEDSSLPCDQENGEDLSNSLSSDESDALDSENEAKDTSQVPEGHNDENLNPATLDDEELMAYQSYKISRLFGYDTDSAEVEAETDRVTQATENMDINGSTNGTEARDEASKASENESSASMNRHHQRSLLDGSKL